MAKNCSKTFSAKKPTTLSGPHICSQVGHDLMSVVKDALLTASKRSNGVVSSAEIENIFDLLAKTPEIFSLYTQNFNACADIHRNRSFAKINPASLARFILQSYCKSIVGRVFVHQIEHSDLRWIEHFLDGLLIHVDQVVDPQFTGNIFARYRALSLDVGAKLEISAVFRDQQLQILVARLFARLRGDTDNHQALGNTINRHLGKTFHLSGPSPLKVINQDLSDFFDLLVQNINPTGFRKGVNAHLSVPA